MILKNCKINWTKGQHGYVQGIRGRNNYRHRDSSGFYNGYGGARLNIDMELELQGIDTETGKVVSVDLKDYFLLALGRKIMSDKLFGILPDCLPDEIEIDTESNRISDASMKIIKERYDQIK